MSDQSELPFGKAGSRGDGYDAWHVQRKNDVAQAARHLNLPLGHQVEVWLKGGVRLRGKLTTREELLFFDHLKTASTEFLVDNVPFRFADLESCLRTD